MVTFHQVFIFSHCKSFYLLDQIKSNWLHWKSETNRTGPGELDELKCSKSLNHTTSYAHWYAFLYLHSHIKTFIYLSHWKSEKNYWAEWARILTNTLTDEQICSLTCFLVFAFLNIYQNIYFLSWLKIRNTDWAIWAKWARILQKTLTDEQLCN